MACNPLNEFQFALGWVVIICTVLLAFAPQWLKQCRMRSHIGMSLPNFLCGTIVSFLQILNYFCCKYADTFRCCGSAHTTRQCLAAVEPVLQIVLPFVCYLVVLALYFAYFDLNSLTSRGLHATAELGRARVQLISMLVVMLLLAAFLAVLMLASGGIESPNVYMYGVVSEVVASIVLATHWSLQMWETLELRSVGSLSLFGLMIGCIGSFLNAYSLSVHGGVAVGASNLVAAIMIGATCALGVYVEWRGRRGVKLSRQGLVHPG